MTPSQPPKWPGLTVLPSFTAETATHFEQQETGKDDRQWDTDHSDDLWAEVIEAAPEPEQQGSRRTPQDSVPELKERTQGR